MDEGLDEADARVVEQQRHVAHVAEDLLRHGVHSVAVGDVTDVPGQVNVMLLLTRSVW